MPCISTEIRNVGVGTLPHTICLARLCLVLVPSVTLPKSDNHGSGGKKNDSPPSTGKKAIVRFLVICGYMAEIPTVLQKRQLNPQLQGG